MANCMTIDGKIITLGGSICSGTDPYFNDDNNEPPYQEPAGYHYTWAKQAGGLDSDIGYCSAIDSASNVYVTGSFSSTATFGETQLISSGGIEVFVAKLDPDGNWLWAIKSDGNFDNSGKSIAVIGNDIYVTGTFSNTISFGATSLTSSGDKDCFVAKLTNNGSWLWATQGGGNGADFSNSIAVADGGLYIAGIFKNSATFGATTLSSLGVDVANSFVARLSSSGDWLWAVSSSSTKANDIFSVGLDKENNIYVTGTFSTSVTFGMTSLTSNGSNDVFVAKLDSNGSWLWAVKGGGTIYDYGRGLATDSLNNVYIVGFFIASATFGSTTLTSSGSFDLEGFVAKLDSNGNWLWAVSYGGVLNESGTYIATDSHNNIYITGTFEGTALFGTHSLSSLGGQDIFAAKLDSNGNWLWASSINGVDTNNSNSIAVLGSGSSIYLTGQFTGTIALGNNNLTSYGAVDIFITKLTPFYVF